MTDNNIDNNEVLKNECLRLVAQKTDIRSKKPEFRIILDTLQELSPTTLQELLDEINSDCECEMFTYSSLHHYINALTALGAVKQDIITKEITIEQSQITKEIRYLPVSSYCISIFGISVIVLVMSLYTNNMVIQATTSVVIGALYITAQIIGDEFSIIGIMQKLKSSCANLKIDDAETNKPITDK